MTGRRNAILVCVFGAVMLSIVASGAVTLEPQGSDTLSGTDELVAEPHPGPGGDYAFINEDAENGDEVMILLSAANSEVEGDGVSSNSVTEITEVIRITYFPEEESDDTIELWLEHIDDDAAEIVEFRSDGESIEGESNSVTLGEGQSVDVGFEVDTRGVETADPVKHVRIHATGSGAADDDSTSDDGADGDGGGGGGGTLASSDDDSSSTGSPSGTGGGDGDTDADADTGSGGQDGLEEEEAESLFELGGFATVLGSMVLLLLLILLFVILRQAQRRYTKP